MSKRSFLQRVGSALMAFGGGELPTNNPGTSVGKATEAYNFVRGITVDSGSETSVRRPFEQSVWVQRAIKEISGPIGAVELKFYEGDNEITDAPWLAFWKKPCRNLTRPDFVEALVGWLKLDGEAFIIVQPEFVAPFPDVQTQWPPLMLARPDCMKPIKSDNGEALGWEYQGRNGRRLRLGLDQVIQPRFWNPYDDLRGMSEYEAARVATEGDYLSGRFALNMARANGDTGVIITMKEGSSLTDEQQQQVRDQLRAKQARAREGKFASIFVPADLEIQDPKVRAPDAQFVAQRLENRHEIYIAFGVPPSMADVVASYSVGSASDWYRLITGTCVPTAEKIAEAISEIASRMHGSPVEAYFEWDDHPVMQTVRRERIDAWVKLVEKGMPGELASETLDLDLPEYPAGKVGLLPMGLYPFDPTTIANDQPENTPTLAEPEATVTESRRALQALIARRQNPAPVVTCDCCNFDFASLQLKASDSADVKLWKTLAAKRREVIRTYEVKFNAVLMTARREVLQKIETAQALQAKAPIQRAAAADFLFDLANFDRVFQAQMRAVGLNALQKAGDQLFAELGKDDPWKMPQAEAIQFIKDRENKLSNVSQDIFDRVKAKIETGLNDGASLKDIATSVRGEFNDISAGRARTIASTETAAAYGTARDIAMRDAGVQFKRWLTSGNANVRASHRAMNGATVGIDESFTVIDPKTGESDTIRHPADPDGAPWNVINCHCVEVATVKPSEENV